MTELTVFDAIPDSPVAPAAARPRLLVIGTALACAAMTMGMAGLLGIYVETRAGIISEGTVWLPKGVTIPLTQPNMMAITLVMSMVSMAWAVHALRHDDRPNTHLALGLCVLFGFAYLAQTAFLFEIMGMPAAGDDLARPPLFYALIGAHMIIMGAAMLYATVMGLRTLGGNYNAKDVEGIYSVALFWNVAVVLYLIVWYAIYITK